MAGKTMLRYSLFVISVFSSVLVLAESKTNQYIDPVHALTEYEENEDLRKQLEQLKATAKKAGSSNVDFKVEGKKIGDSDLGQTAINRLLEKANNDSDKIKARSRGEITKEQHVTGMADEAMAKLRYDTLSGMGMDPTITGYIFVSESMPESLIRAYARDATRLGMSLVFHGFADKGTSHNKFLEVADKYHTKRNAMSIQADTRLYDAFEIKNVPSIVVTDIASLDICNETGPVSTFTYQSKELSFQKCNPAPEDRYCKLSGSVFTDWAIRKMAENNCTLAKNFLERTHENPATEQNTIDMNLWEKYVQTYGKEQYEWSEYEKEVYKMMQGDFR